MSCAGHHDAAAGCSRRSCGAGLLPGHLLSCTEDGYLVWLLSPGHYIHASHSPPSPTLRGLAPMASARKGLSDPLHLLGCFIWTLLVELVISVQSSSGDCCPSCLFPRTCSPKPQSHQAAPRLQSCYQPPWHSDKVCSLAQAAGLDLPCLQFHFGPCFLSLATDTFANTQCWVLHCHRAFAHAGIYLEFPSPT